MQRMEVTVSEKSIDIQTINTEGVVTNKHSIDLKK